MKVYFDSVGCRLNQAEIEKMALDFRSAGHEIVEKAGQADIVVVNTCAVTAAAASDSRQKIRQANRAGVSNIVVTGCWSTLAPDEAQSMAGVTRVIPNAQKGCSSCPDSRRKSRLVRPRAYRKDAAAGNPQTHTGLH